MVQHPRNQVEGVPSAQDQSGEPHHLPRPVLRPPQDHAPARDGENQVQDTERGFSVFHGILSLHALSPDHYIITAPESNICELPSGRIPAYKKMTAASRPPEERFRSSGARICIHEQEDCSMIIVSIVSAVILGTLLALGMTKASAVSSET